MLYQVELLPPRGVTIITICGGRRAEITQSAVPVLDLGFLAIFARHLASFAVKSSNRKTREGIAKSAKKVGKRSSPAADADVLEAHGAEAT
jgi:DNA invertase Pin-like site-specific DNA recombinase